MEIKEGLSPVTSHYEAPCNSNSDITDVLRLPTSDMLFLANREMKSQLGARFDLCSITNAKSGLCSEDCRFCAQSSRHQTQSPTYPLKSPKEIVDDAQRAQETHAQRFGIVTSGNALSTSELHTIAEAIRRIKELGIEPCASLGKLDRSALEILKQAGLSRYHHNIETSREFFPQVVTTHSFEDRMETIKTAQEVGLEVCSGGIIGLGESEEDRIGMATVLRELAVDSVPINILVPIGGTPFENNPPLSITEILRTIAIFRLVLKDKTIKIAAGRESALRDFQGLAFWAGANGMLIGGYLTVKGREVAEDQRMVRELEKLWNG